MALTMKYSRERIFVREISGEIHLSDLTDTLFDEIRINKDIKICGESFNCS